MINKFLFSIYGIIIGSTIECTILTILRNPNFMRFWGYAGFFFIPALNVIFYLLPFVSYIFIEKKLRLFSINHRSFIFIGIFFALSDFLSAFLTNILARKLINSPFFNFAFYGTFWLIFPLLSFWIATLLVKYISVLRTGSTTTP